MANCHFPPTFEAESCFNYHNEKGGFSLYNVRYKDHSHDPVSHEVNLNLEEICNGKGINVAYGANHNEGENQYPIRSLHINQDEKDNTVKVSYKDGLEFDTHIEADVFLF